MTAQRIKIRNVGVISIQNPFSVPGQIGPTGATGPGSFFKPPTADPHVVGVVWNNAGVLTISAG